MIDVYAAAATFADRHRLAADLAAAVVRVEQVPDIPMFRQNTAAFVHSCQPTHCPMWIDSHTSGCTYSPTPAPSTVTSSSPLASGAVSGNSPTSWPGGRRPVPGRPDLGPADRGTRGRLAPARPREHQRGAGSPRPSRPDRRAGVGKGMMWQICPTDAVIGNPLEGPVCPVLPSFPLPIERR
jgi:hypothetical protein